MRSPRGAHIALVPFLRYRRGQRARAGRRSEITTDLAYAATAMTASTITAHASTGTAARQAPM